jgi:hypothetical protein
MAANPTTNTSIEDSTVMGICCICMEQVSLEEQESELYRTHTQCRKCAETKEGAMHQKLKSRKYTRMLRGDASPNEIALVVIVLAIIIAIVAWIV